MDIIFRTERKDGGAAAAAMGAEKIRAILEHKREVNIILATGLSQFDMLASLKEADLPWERINVFHLDEYIGLSIRHPASFRAVLWQEFVSKLPVPLRSFAWIDGEVDPEAEAARLDALIAQHPIDVAFIGIGENGHLAFNDPPADFYTEKPFIIVTLDDRCRGQQAGEGWFASAEDMPTHAISMSIRQILKSACLIVTCPDERKAEAVRDCVEKVISNRYPATILRTHPDATLFLDAGSASMLSDPPSSDTVRRVPVEVMP